MVKLAGWPAALLGAACACAPAPTLRHASDGWKIESTPYFVAGTPSGALMPEEWILRNYATQDGELRRKDKKDYYDLWYGRVHDDGFLLVRSDLLGADDQQKSLRVLIERVLSHTRHEMRPVQGPDEIAMLGADAIEAIVDTKAAEDRPPLRHYIVLFRSLSKPQVVTLRYTNVPQLFENGLADAKDLVRRMRF